MTALMKASKLRDTTTVQTLLDVGADIDAKNINGWTVLKMAQARKQIEVVEILKKAGASEAK